MRILKYSKASENTIHSFTNYYFCAKVLIFHYSATTQNVQEVSWYRKIKFYYMTFEIPFSAQSRWTFDIFHGRSIFIKSLTVSPNHVYVWTVAQVGLVCFYFNQLDPKRITLQLNLIFISFCSEIKHFYLIINVLV